MKTRILRGRFPAVNVEWTDDYTQKVQAANVSIEVDGDAPEMKMVWHIQGNEHCSAAFDAIRKKKPDLLMDVLDEYVGELPALAESSLQD